MAARLNAVPGSRPGLRRRVAWGAVVLVVLALHFGVTRSIAERMTDLAQESSMPPRIEVAYVRDMALSAPPPVAARAAPPAAPPRPVRRVRPARPASSPAATAAASAAASAPDLPVASAAASEPDAASATREPPSAVEPPAPEVAAASEPAAASAPATASAPAFEWPASTRMSYTLTGNYRGQVSGSAQVEWIRVDSRYQVHLDLIVGPSVAPIITRRMSSDGEIAPTGLVPHRYDQDTKVVLRDRNRVTILFEPDGVVLANGDRRDTVPGVQDTASQFVQLTYVFSTRPELLRIGGSVDIPLALPHKVDVWTYDVVEEETLYTEFGPLPAIHLKPRRTSSKVGELSAEIWFAPQLRYLPVRIRIQQDDQNFIDLLISKKPQMAAPTKP